MVRKIFGVGVVVLLVGALVGGGAYLLLRDSDSASAGGRGGQSQAAAIESGAGGGRWNSVANDGTVVERGGRGSSGTAVLAAGAGGGRGSSGTNDGAVVERGGRGSSGTADLAAAEGSSGYRGGNGAAGAGTGTPEAAVAPADWLTVTGVVVEMAEELVVRTADGTEVTFGLGPSSYRDASGVAIAVGDEVRVTGFYEGGELKAGTVENLSSGQALALRDESGRPLWSGRGRRGQ